MGHIGRYPRPPLGSSAAVGQRRRRRRVGKEGGRRGWKRRVGADLCVQETRWEDAEVEGSVHGERTEEGPQKEGLEAGR